MGTARSGDQAPLLTALLERRRRRLNRRGAALFEPLERRMMLNGVTATITTATGDVQVDINLQNLADLESIQFKSLTNNALVPGAYFGLVSRGTAGWQYSNGQNAGSVKLVSEINNSSQTAFPTETILDFGNFWNTGINALNVSLVYNTTPHGGGAAIPVSGTVSYAGAVAPTPVSPGFSAAPGSATSIAPSFSWSAGTGGATEYGIHVNRLQADGTYALVFDSTDPARGITISGTATSYQLPAGVLVDGGQYRWDISSKVNGVWGVNSSSLYFGYFTAPVPVTPGLSTSPGSVTALVPNFSWSGGAGGATEYGLFIDKLQVDGTYARVFDSTNPARNITASSYQLPGGILTDGGQYRWSMSARINGAWGANSSPLYFSYSTAPTLVSPGLSTAPGAVTVVAPTFSWNGSGSGASEYGLYIDKLQSDGTFASVFNSTTYRAAIDGNASTYSLPAGILTGGGQYRWYMNARIGGVWGVNSSPLYFVGSTVPTPLSPGSAGSPGSLTTLVPMFSWNGGGSGASEFGIFIYQLQSDGTYAAVFDSTDPARGITIPAAAASYQLPAGILTDNGHYLWNINAKINGIWGPHSSPLYFTSTANGIAVGKVSANIDRATGDVTVDINLQNAADLESIQFKSLTFNALIPGNYVGFASRGTTGWLYSNGNNAGSTKLVAEINNSNQTAFSTETVLDFGNFWNTGTNAQNISLVYNTTPHGGGSAIAVSGTVTYAGVSSLPDLSVSAITTPPTATSGQPMHVGWTVGNIGNASTSIASWYDRLVISTNDTYGDADDIYLGSVLHTGALAANAQYTGQADVQLPPGISGSYRLFIKSDENSVVFESINKANNLRESDAAIAVAPVPYPDLRIENLALTDPTNTGAFTLAWDTANRGTGAATGGFMEHILVKNLTTNAVIVDVDQAVTGDLAVNGVLNHTRAFTTPTAGQYQVTITTDSLSQVYEFNAAGHADAEANNIVQGQYEADADLTVSNLTVTPSSPQTGANAVVTWNDLNTGNRSISNAFFDRVTVINTTTGENFGSTDVYYDPAATGNGNIAAGDSRARQFTFRVPDGARGLGNLQFTVTTDINNSVVEYNSAGTAESNNAAVLSIAPTIAPYPDLKVSGLAVTPAAPKSGGSVTINWNDANTGNAPTNAAWYDQVVVINTTTGQTLVNTNVSYDPAVSGNIAAGDARGRQYSFTLPDGPAGVANLQITVTADSGNSILEYNPANTGETNNAASISVNSTLAPYPDLVTGNLIVPVETYSGRSFDVSWTVTNSGNADATGTWSDQVFLSDDAAVGNDLSLGTFTFTGTIAAGQTITRTQAVSAPIDLSGDRYVIVTANANRQIFDLNSANNTAISAQPVHVRLSPFPNLQVTTVTPPPTAFSSQQAVVSWTVKNTGNGATSVPNWSDGVWLSANNILDNSDIFLGASANPAYLNAGDSYSNSLTVTLPQGISGNYYFIVMTDYGNQVYEYQHEDDNVTAGGPTAVQLTPPPDLQVRSVIAPSDGFSGQPLTVTWTVKNAGVGKTLETGWYDQVYMSTDTTLDAGDRSLGTFSHSGALDAAATYSNTQTLNLPVGVSGNYYLIVKTDAGNQVYEQAFEGNNTGQPAAPTNIHLTPPPDLAMGAVTAPANAIAGHNLTVAYHVTNSGSSATPNSSWTDAIYLSTTSVLNTSTAALLGTVSHSGSLAAGDGYDGSTSVQVPYTQAVGSYYIIVMADQGASVYELNKTNNSSASGQLVVSSQPPDLVVTAASAPGAAQAGTGITVNWTVTNQGTGDTVVGSWVDRVIASQDNILGNADDVVLGSFTHAGVLNAGASYAQSQPVNLPFTFIGTYNLFVVTDAGLSVYEGTHENNNASGALPVNVTRNTPDLQVTAITSPVSAPAGQSIAVSWMVQNFGNARTNANYWYDEVFLSRNAAIDGTAVSLGTQRHTNPLDPSAQYVASGNFTVPSSLSGSFYVLVRTDTNNDVLEDPFENNNVRVSAQLIAVAANTAANPIPDLATTSVVAPSTAISGQPLTVTWTVRNNGDPTGIPAWYDAVYLSLDQVFDRNTDIFLGYADHSGALPGGSSYTVSKSLTLPVGISGPYYVFVASDSGNAIPQDPNRTNNVASAPTATQVNLSPPADLVVGTITVPSNGTPGQNATLTYTVRNQGTNPAVGTWTDSLYISADDQWDLGDSLFGRVQHTGDVAGGGSYSQSITAPLPGVLPGNYKVIVRTDILNHVPEGNENNNIGASLDKVTIDAQALALGTPATGTLSQGQAIYYRIDVPSGKTLSVNLTGAASAFDELYASDGTMPSRTIFDASSKDPSKSNQTVVISGTRAGTYYILAYGNSVPSASAAYTITASTPSLSITGLTPNHGSNLGTTTIAVAGTQFTADAIVSLVGAGGVTLNAGRVRWKDSNTLWATFNLQSLGTGLYDLRVTEAGGTVTKAGSFTINHNPAGTVAITLNLPGALRPGQPGTVSVNYANTGDTDLVAPIIQLTADNANLISAGQTTSTGNTVQFLAINSDGPAGILNPGAKGTISFTFIPTVSGGNIHFTAKQFADSTQPIDWSSSESQSRPASIPADAWHVIWTNFANAVGNTPTSYQAALADDATQLSQIGQYTTDVGRLLSFEVQQAASAQPRPILTSATDANLAAPGLSLQFTRLSLQSISGRFALGPMGRGWVNSWEISATADPTTGDVTVQMPGVPRLFRHQANGSYAGSPGDAAIVTLIAGAYTLRETNGTRYVFRSDGPISYIEDPNGNRITAGYTAGRLTSLAHSSGAGLTLSYNAQGRLSQIIDQAGRSTTYAYDASGEHLLSATSPAGTTSYTYQTAAGPQQHAMLSITNPGNTHHYFTYDATGRLIGESNDGSVGSVAYAYDSAGGVSITDATNGTTRLLYDDAGQIGQSVDPLWNATRFEYDDAHRVTRMILPTDLTYTYAYDPVGNLISQTDPQGSRVDLTYDTTFGDLLTLRDPNGNVTHYGYDANGNLGSVTHADGSAETYLHDAAGDVRQWANRRGDAVGYSYDSHGRLSRKDFLDGSHTDYTYDLHDNLLAATDASGSITMQYDAADRLTRVDYPDGKHLAYSYDAGGRRTQSMDQDGFTTTYSYNAAGQLIDLSNGLAALVAHYTYDGAGRLLRRDLGNGTYSIYAYDAAGNLLHLVNYALDGSTSSSFTYAYDALSRPTQLVNGGANWTYGYNAGGELISASSSNGDNVDYSFDAAGNRTSVIKNGITTAYAANSLNQYTQVGAIHYSYDTNGNLVQKNDGITATTTTYDAENRIIGSTTSGRMSAYSYNALGNLTSISSGSSQVNYLIDQGRDAHISAAYSTIGVSQSSSHYTFGTGLEQQVSSTQGAAYFNFDGSGSTVALTNNAGQVLSSYSYSPFGEASGGQSSVTTPFTFLGRVGAATQETGQVISKAGEYEPSLGRLIISNVVVPIVSAIAGHFGYESPLPGTEGGLGAIIEGGGLQSIIISTLLDAPNRILDRVVNTVGEDGDPYLQYSLGTLIQSVEFLAEDDNAHNVGRGIFAIGRQHKYGFDVGNLTDAQLAEDGIFPLGDPRASGDVSVVRPKDPNDLVGPAGFGPEKWLSIGQSAPYTIRFENQSTATAPAKQIRITETLDPNLDYRTFRLGDFGWGANIFHIPANTAFYSQRIDLTASLGLFVDVSAGVDVTSGQAFWTLGAIDPKTGEVPTDASLGFLPPDDAIQSGEGFVSYTVNPRGDATTGAVVSATARIVFDAEGPIDTPSVSNTLDSVRPSSQVAALLATEPGNNFLVTWSGTDDATGSALADYTIYVSDNGGPFTAWLSNTTLTQASYAGRANHTYAFYSVARDNAGNVELAPLTPDAQTTTPAATIADRRVFYNNSVWDGNAVAANADDDAAIAPDKQALLPGQTAIFANYTNYSLGLNGIIVDVASLANGDALTSADFTFKVGNGNNLASWSTAPTPITVLVRAGKGTGGSDRIELIWADNAIQKQWLQVTVLANANTGLAAPDVFYFGNAVGETANSTTSAAVDSADDLGARSHKTGLAAADLSNVFDFNRDKHVDTQDELIARGNHSGLSPLKLISIPALLPTLSPAASLSAASSSTASITVTTVNPTEPLAPVIAANITSKTLVPVPTAPASVVLPATRQAIIAAAAPAVIQPVSTTVTVPLPALSSPVSSAPVNSPKAYPPINPAAAVPSTSQQHRHKAKRKAVVKPSPFSVVRIGHQPSNLDTLYFGSTASAVQQNVAKKKALWDM